MRTERNDYLETDEEVAETARATISYIIEGQQIAVISDLRGLCVYGVVGVLREHDALLYGTDTEAARLDEEQRQRLQEVENEVEKAVNANMQFFPFGHNQAKFKVDYSATTGDHDDRQRAVPGSSANSVIAVREASRKNFAKRVISNVDRTRSKPGVVNVTKVKRTIWDIDTSI